MPASFGEYVSGDVRGTQLGDSLMNVDLKLGPDLRQDAAPVDVSGL